MYAWAAEIKGGIITMFRCPYCGEKVFTKELKMGIHSTFGISPRCPKCKNISRRELDKNGYNTVSFAFGLASMLILVFASFLSSIFIIISIIVLCVFYFFYNYYLCHFEITNKKEINKTSMLNILVSSSKKLWPNIRQGEIYLIIPDNIYDPHTVDFHTIAALENLIKKENGYLCTFRIIKEAHENTINKNDVVKIVNDFDSEDYNITNGIVL